MPSALLPFQQILDKPDELRLVTCVKCAEHAGATFSTRPLIVKRDAAIEARLQESGRNYATAQLLISAKKLAMSHLERRGRIKADRTTVPICDTCGQEAPEHGPHCAVGMTLHWIEEFTHASLGAATPAPRASSAAGDLSLLISAINIRAGEIYGGEGDDASDRADAKDLCRALARLLNGESLRAAFGAPGDWGYSTPIGKALAAAYASAATVTPPSRELPSIRHMESESLVRCDDCGEVKMDFWGVAGTLVCVDCPKPAVRNQPDGYFGEVERGPLEPEGGAPSYWRNLDGGAK